MKHVIEKFGEIGTEIATVWDKNDPWASCMELLFCIAEESCFNRDGTVAASLEYRPGAVSEVNPDNTYDLSEVSDEKLAEMAEFFEEMRKMLVSQGHSY